MFGSGAANVVIRNSNISGEGGAIHLIDGGAAASIALSNLRLSSGAAMFSTSTAVAPARWW